MSDWKIEFHKALVDALVEGGSLICDNADIYGWRDYDGTRNARQYIEHVGIDYAKTTYDDSTWDEFQGTFTDNRTVVGTDVDVVLNDGERLKFRYVGTLSSLIQAVVS